MHPLGNKRIVADAAVEVLPTPDEVRIALAQHLGAPAEEFLEPRTEVALGDLVGRAVGFVSAPVHASVSGTVSRSTAATLPNGRHVRVIPIKAAEEQPLSGRDLWEAVYGGDWPRDGFDRHGPEEIADAARRAGLVGLGGAAFPTHVKLARNPEKPIRSLLINGCECEPYLTADFRLMLEAPEPVIAGALLAQHATGARDVSVCVEDNKLRAVDALRRAADGTDVDVRVLETRVSPGRREAVDPGRAGQNEVPLGGLPLDVGVVVLNVGTAAALARAVLRGRPLTHRIVTVAGGGDRHAEEPAGRRSASAIAN